MLIRILADNPGHTFSRNIDAKFVATIKDLYKQGRDHRVHGFLRETLDALELQRSWDEDLKLLLQMWSAEKAKNNSRPNGLRVSICAIAFCGFGNADGRNGNRLAGVHRKCGRLY